MKLMDRDEIIETWEFCNETGTICENCTLHELATCSCERYMLESTIKILKQEREKDAAPQEFPSVADAASSSVLDDGEPDLTSHPSFASQMPPSPEGEGNGGKQVPLGWMLNHIDPDDGVKKILVRIFDGCGMHLATFQSDYPAETTFNEAFLKCPVIGIEWKADGLEVAVDDEWEAEG